jgi:hypothetical protein
LALSGLLDFTWNSHALAFSPDPHLRSLDPDSVAPSNSSLLNAPASPAAAFFNLFLAESLG